MNEQQAREKSVAMFREATPASPDAPIEEWRAGFEAMAAQIPLADKVTVEPVDADGVPCLKVTAPGVAGDRLVIHYHSGGYVMGSANAYREFASRLSEATGAPVLLPDYRLAPEHPYPAAADDGLTVYEWALRHHDAGKLMLTGDSAGGGLCMATLMSIRDKGLPAPTCAVPISPLLDLAGEGDSANIETDPLINRDLIVGMGQVYIGQTDPHDIPLASPQWGEHHDLPPVLLIVSAAEALRDDSVRLAASIGRANGKVRLSMYPDVIHIWTFFPFLDATREAMAEIEAFAAEYFSG